MAELTPEQIRALYAKAIIAPRKPFEPAPFGTALIGREEYQKGLAEVEKPIPDFLKEPLLAGFEQMSGKTLTPEQREELWISMTTDPKSRRWLNENVVKLLPKYPPELLKTKVEAAVDERLPNAIELKELMELGMTPEADELFAKKFLDITLSKRYTEFQKAQNDKEKAAIKDKLEKEKLWEKKQKELGDIKNLPYDLGTKFSEKEKKKKEASVTYYNKERKNILGGEDYFKWLQVDKNWYLVVAEKAPSAATKAKEKIVY